MRSLVLSLTLLTGRDHLPLSDVVLCSTSLPQEARIRLADVAQQMGAKHVLDLTGEVTHLIVGDSDTPKYKYVAKERPDIIVLDPAWIDAVREVWIDGGDVDVQGLERIHRCPTFVGLKICITGFPDQAQRNHLSATIEHEGAEYHGDLTKQITHLIVAQPGSAKYKAAQDWRINTVSMKWLEDSAARGMALDPRYYDPTMPYQEQGKGAYRKEGGLPTSLGKRLRNEESQTSAASAGGKRKLRRHASRRLEDHSQDMWQDISAADATTVAPSEATDQWTAGDEDSQLTAGRAAAHPQVKQSFDIRQDQTVAIAPKQEGIFSGWCIATEGFEKEKTMRLAQYLEPNGAHIVKGLQDLYSMREEQHETRCLLVPHAQTNPTAHILQPGGGIVVATEWWVERCIHYKQVLDPKQDALSQPLFNILGFSKLTISTTGFSGVDYRQVAEAVKLAGATYQEQLTPTISVLISGTPTVKKEKAYYAAKHQISVVTAEWLWTSLRQKRKTSMDRFKIELPKYDPNNATGSASAAPSPAPSEISKRSAETGSK
jgi:DNA replication regulator DPB11